jgi:uncharacterized membrane protein
MDFEFPCPTCQNKIKAQDDWIGMSARCPTCDSIITVPDRENIDTQIEVQKENETASNSETKSKLIKCPLCNNEISSHADKCPYCGEPTQFYKKQKSHVVYVLLGIFFGWLGANDVYIGLGGYCALKIIFLIMSIIALLLSFSAKNIEDTMGPFIFFIVVLVLLIVISAFQIAVTEKDGYGNHFK